MLKGRSVVVHRVETAYDEDRDPVPSLSSESVEGVLVAPGATSDVAGSARPDGTKVAFTLAFPKGYDRSLRGCRVSIAGEPGEYAVVGDPRPCRENCPTKWWMAVEVEACDG
ncbi:hypothetical protein [Paraeggerthella hongkongensis]|uniref:hypothetical protein n=1 Tax=Paraeggerthella hongkongensis TaxID=230658 RepID=UPI0011CE863F|nr:hypothetical protein [Paraeggerthella hongkongensis]